MTPFYFEAHLPWDRHRVFVAFRDRVEEYAALAPNIVSVKVLKREKLDNSQIRMSLKWRGKINIPRVVRPILKPDMLAWKDDIIWDEKKYECHWTVESFFFNEFFHCEGSWKFKAAGKKKTLVQLEGSLHVYISHFPPFPDRLVQGASKIIEKMILNHLKPNLTQGINALRKLLESDEKKLNYGADAAKSAFSN